MSDIDYWSDEYNREIEQFSAAVQYLQSLADSFNNKLITQATSDCEAKLIRIKEVKKSYGLELRLVKTRAVKIDHEENIKSQDEKVATLTRQYKEIQMSNNKKNLLSTGTTNPYDTKGRTNDELLAGANVLQDKTVESLVRSKALIEQSREVGTATVEQLRAQRDQMKEIEADIDKIESHMERAEKLVLNFTRRMASDRLIQAFTVMNVIVLISLVIYVGVTGKTLEAGARENPYLSQIIGAPPTRSPTILPSHAPSRDPTIAPTLISPYPTAMPSYIPSFRPSDLPTTRPSHLPTSNPTLQPTPSPSEQPSSSPSTSPTLPPTVTSNPTAEPTV